MADPAGCPLGFVLSMEGADPVVGPDTLGLGVEQWPRILSLAHDGPSRYAHGTGSAGGLLPMGWELLAEMASLGMTCETTHLFDDLPICRFALTNWEVRIRCHQ